MKTIQERMKEIFRELALIEKKDAPSDADSIRFDELSLEFNKLKMQEEKSGIDSYLNKLTTEPMKIDTGESDSEPNIKLYNRSNLDELRSFIKAKDKFGITEPVSAGKFIRGLITGDWKDAEVERRALTTTTSGGGWIIPELISSQIITMALAKSQCFKAGTFTLPMESKTLVLPKIIEMPEILWKTEGEKYDAGVGMQFSGITLEAKTLIALVKMSVELAQDGINVEQVIENAMAESIALELDRAVLNGAGANNEPTGIILTDDILVEDLENNPITSFDFLSNAYFKLEAENEFATGLIAPSDMFKSLDLLKDENNNRLLPPLSYEGTYQKPSYQKLSSNQLSNSAILGDFSKVVIGMRTDLQVDVTDKAGDSYERLQVWIRCYLRADVGIKRPKAFCHIKNFGEIAS